MFIDARNMGHLINRRIREFSEEDIQRIANTYHSWREAPQPPEGGDKSSQVSDLSVRIPSVLHSANPSLYKELKIKAEEMRANPTEAEKLLWKKLRNKQLGIKFRQQHVINKLIVDFCSIKSALVVEVDGKIHKNKIEADAERTGILEQEGYKVIRFSNNEVQNDINSVLNKIKETSRHAPPQPPEGGIKSSTKGYLRMSKESPLGDIGALGDYEDIKGFCNSVSIDRVRELDYVLTPGRYVGLPEEEDDFDFNERFTNLKAEFEGQLKEEEKLNILIKENLEKVKLL